MITFTKEQIKEIAGELECGLRAFYHQTTGELMFVPDPNKFDDTEAWEDDLQKLENNFLDYREIEAMESRESFIVMEDFVEQLKNSTIKIKLLNALEKRKPFREFKCVIDNAGDLRELWFSYKSQRNIEWVAKQIKTQTEIDEQENEW